jgi:metal-dependent amidase/aminoacylase/carboxypeptidase family protein
LVAVLANGAGRTLLIRTEMDALPLKEQTGLAYASQVTVKDASGTAVGVMHACGHDANMTSWIGVPRCLPASETAGAVPWSSSLSLPRKIPEERERRWPMVF